MDGGAAFYVRARDDAALKSALGTKATGYAQIEGGWPESFTDEAQFPQATYFVASDTVIRPGIRSFEVQVDIWSWSDPAVIETVEERLLALFDEVHWTASNVRWQGLALGGSDRPAGPGSPIRKMRRFNLLGASLS